MDSREALLDIVGFDAADIMRRGGVQSLHEQMKRRAELKQEEEHVINPSVDTRSPAGGGVRLTWCPTVFLCSLLGVLGVGLAARTFTLDDFEEETPSLSWNRSATSWNCEETGGHVDSV